MAVPQWSENWVPAPPLPPSEARRVVVVQPRETRREELNSFGRVLTDSIRRSLSRKKGYSVVDADSVNAVLQKSRSSAELQRQLAPDLLISSTFVGAGDSMTVLVTVRDLKSRGSGVRIASGKFEVDNTEASIPALVRLVGAQVDNLRQTWTVHMAPAAKPAVAPKLPRGAQ
jgi:TolB-like protein